MNEYELLNMIHRIRENHYAETKELCPEELIKKISDEAGELEKSMNIAQTKKNSLPTNGY